MRYLRSVMRGLTSCIRWAPHAAYLYPHTSCLGFTMPPHLLPRVYKAYLYPHTLSLAGPFAVASRVPPPPPPTHTLNVCIMGARRSLRHPANHPASLAPPPIPPGVLPPVACSVSVHALSARTRRRQAEAEARHGAVHGSGQQGRGHELHNVVAVVRSCKVRGCLTWPVGCLSTLGRGGSGGL